MPKYSYSIRLILPLLPLFKCVTPDMITEILRLSKSTVHSVLKALVNHGIATRRAYGIYCVEGYTVADAVRAALMSCGLKIGLTCEDYARMLFEAAKRNHVVFIKNSWFKCPSTTPVMRALSGILKKKIENGMIMLDAEYVMWLASRLCTLNVRLFDRLWGETQYLRITENGINYIKRMADSPTLTNPTPSQDDVVDFEVLPGRPSVRGS